MAKKLKSLSKTELLKHLTINEAAFAPTFTDNFLDYAMYSIESRALPDIRDGNKPVHRRILYDMGINKNTSKNPYVKVARRVGSVIGLWHPHGDSSVEEALTNMAAPWKHTMPPVEIKGNGGSIFGDPAAAGRYIEARTTETGDEYVKNLNPKIVPFVSNYDDSEQEPTVLPAKLPYLIINGAEGIAVGYSISVPTHNPIEVVNAFIEYTKNPKISTQEILEIMPGPDFPTGGEIANTADLLEIYETGQGRIRVRGKVRYEKKDNSLHIYEVPFTSSGAVESLVTKITAATMETVQKVKGRERKVPPKYPWAKEVEHHSDKDGIDIKISLKRGVDVDKAIQDLYAKTPLETTFSYQFNALNNKNLRRYSLKRYFKEYLAFQHEITRNEFQLEYETKEKRMEIIRGLLILQTVLDEVIASARNVNGKAELEEVLTTGKIVDGVPKKFHKKIKTFAFSQPQAEYIATLPIHRISRLDYQGFVDEGKRLQKEMEYALSIVDSNIKRRNLIIKRHQTAIEQLDQQEYARKTELLNIEKSTAVEIEVKEQKLYVSIDKYGYVRIEEKAFDNAIETSNKQRLGFFDETGMLYYTYLDEAKPTTGKGSLASNISELPANTVGMTTNVEVENAHGLFIFADGNVKVSPLKDFMTKTRRKSVQKAKTKFDLLLYVDIPQDAKSVTINDKTFKLDKLSHGHGHGRNEFKKGLTQASVKFK